MTRPFFFDEQKLFRFAERYRAAYVMAKPFSHVVLDDFLPSEVLDCVTQEFPPTHDARWYRRDSPYEKKLSIEDETLFPEFTRSVLYAFNSSVFVTFLEKLTGIEGIIPDPHFRGGGLHDIAPGGKLGIHADFNWYPRLCLHRRINLLVYLNKDWKPEYGGSLELWDRKMTRCEQKILPLFNRCVIFNITDFSYHGHPEPLKCPKEMTRKSLALYYYTKDRPLEEISSPHSTLFQQRPGIRDEVPSKGRQARTLLKKFIPPIFMELVRPFEKGGEKLSG